MGNIVHRHNKEDDIMTPAIAELSADQIKIIQRTWSIPAAKVSLLIQFPLYCLTSNARLLFQPYDAGEKVLYMYFDRFPHNQEKFQAFKNTPLLMLKVKLNWSRIECLFFMFMRKIINIRLCRYFPGNARLQVCELWHVFRLFYCTLFFKPCRAHASKIMNVISSCVDSLDKDPDLSAIKKMVAEGLKIKS